jgi:hypothetical protein
VFDYLKWKFIAGFSILAMIISIISSGVGGIRIPVMIFRSVVAAFIFALIAALLNLTAYRFFPELFEEGETEDSKDTVYQPNGSNVDIVLPGEDFQHSAHPDSEAAPEVSDILPSGSAVNSNAETEKVPVSDNDEISDEGPPADIDRYSGTFIESTEEDDTNVYNVNNAEAPVTEVSDLEADPEQMAKAIQTVITRDEKVR